MRPSLDLAALLLVSVLLLVVAELAHALLPTGWQAGHSLGTMLLHALLLACALLPIFIALLRQQARLQRALAASEQQRDEAQAREARLASGLNSGDFVVYDWCLGTGEILLHGQAPLFGGQSGVTGFNSTKWRSLVHPDDLPGAQRALRAHLCGETPAYAHVHRMLDQAGNWRQVRERGQVVARDASGRAQRLIGSACDITRQLEADLQVQAGERLLRSVLDLLPIGVFWKDCDGRYLGANQAFLSHYGVGQVIGLTDAELVDPTTAAGFGAHDRAVLEGRLDERNALRQGVGPDGELHWYTSNKVRLLDSRGVTTGVIGTFDDVTALKRTEQNLRETSERYELALRGSSDGLWDWNLETNDVYYSPRFEALLGYAEGEYGRHFSVFEEGLHPDDRAGVLAAIESHLADNAEVDIEYRLKHRSGEWRWYRTRGLAVRDAGGVGRRMAGTLSDITERKERELEITQAREHLSHAIEATDSALVMFDGQQRLVFCNSRYREFYALPVDLVQPGVTYCELVGAFCENFPAFRQGRSLDEYASELFTRHRAGGRPWELELPGRWLLISERPTPDGGVVCQHTDITRLKGIQRDLELALDRAEAASRAKSQFVANVSHELRTPLNGVLGMLQLLEDAGFHAPHDEYVRVAAQSGRALLELINDVLDFSKADAGAADIIEEPFSVPLLIDEVVAANARRAQAKQLQLLPYVDPTVPERLHGDPTRISQVLANLIGNAIKFTDRGEVRIEVLMSAEVDGAVSFSVDDTGVGIPLEAQATIFEPFTQVDGSHTRRHGGTGLGLALTRQQVELMGGRMKLASAPGRGSRFEFTLALRPALASPRTGTGQVLLAVGMTDYRAGLIACLRRLGATLRVCTDPAMLESVDTPLDALIIDTSLPLSDSARLLRQAARRGARVAAVGNAADDSLPPALAGHAVTRVRLPISFTAISDFLQPRVVPQGAGLPAREQAVVRGTLEQLIDCLGATAFESLVDTFCDTMAQRLIDYRHAEVAGDIDRISALSHAMKGVSANLGAARFAECCADIGQACAAGRVPEAHALLSQMLVEVALDLREFAREHIASHRQVGT